MILRDYHMHTNRCDAVATAEEMVLAAIEQGLEEIGISEHSHTAFDDSYCLSTEATEEYRQEVLALREKYRDRISIRVGLEMDCFSDADTEPFDYHIGSVHYLRVIAGTCSARPDPEGVLRDGNCVYIPIDESARLQKEAVERYFGRDWMSFAEAYFETAGAVAEMTGCHIIGHFDLICKFNEGGVFFDEEDPRYIAAWKRAVDRAVKAGVPFEINTGAIAKGYRSRPFPSRAIRDYIREKGGRFILSSDSHRTDTLCYAFDEYEGEVTAAGCAELFEEEGAGPASRCGEGAAR